MVYRHLEGDLTNCKSYLPDILSKNKSENLFLAGNFNINLLNLEYSKQARSFSDFLFQFDMVTTTNKPATETNILATTIEHIITNGTFENDFESVIVKNDITDHFPLTFSTKSKMKSKAKDESKGNFIYKQTFDKTSLEKF